MRPLITMLIALLIATAASAQQQYPSLQKGVQPDKLYHFADVDNVNVFNGNLVITIPIGMTYALDGGLSYQLTLSYNSKTWDLLQVGNLVHARPSTRSNAGIGWVLGFGRFIPHTDPANLSNMPIYESADGGDHLFNSSSGDRTTDGTNLRLRQDSSSTSVRYVDMPDGRIHRFEKKSDGTWALRQIQGPLGTQVVTFSETTGSHVQCGAGTTSYWTISDSASRTHYVCFKNETVNGQDRPMVDRVSLAAPDGKRAVYSFTYDRDITLSAPAEDTDHSNAHTRTHTVVQLKSVSLPESAGQYGFLYDAADGTGRGDAVRSMTLPTRAKISYDYASYIIPSLDKCASTYGLGYGLGAQTTGVYRRTVNAAFPSTSAVWTYSQKLERRTAPPSAYTSVDECDLGDPINSGHAEMYDESIVTVTDPAGNMVENYFSVFPGGDALRTPDPDVSPAGARREHYSLPYGARHPTLDLYLSQKFFDCSTGTCQLKRSRWVRHDRDTTALADISPSRQVAERTWYHGEPANCTVPAATGTSECSRWTASDLSDWDSYGHYRTNTVSGNLKDASKVESRTATTFWNRQNGSDRTIAPTSPWILNTNEGGTVTEAFDGTVTSTLTEQACFDLTTGFLRARRQLAGSSAATGDLLTVYSVGADGNVASEQYYGGDAVKLPATTTSLTLCGIPATLASVEPDYAIDYVWQNGLLTSAKYRNATFFSYQGTFDPAGVLELTKDAATVATTAEYDSAGRMFRLTPTGTAWTSFKYDAATASVPASLTVAQFAAENTAGTGEPLTRSRYYYDGMGRLIQQRTQIDDARWSAVGTTYDGLGRTESTTVPVETVDGAYAALPAGTKKTSYQYDDAGRVLKVTAPDGSAASSAYTGARMTTRTSDYASGATSVATATTTEEQDSFGRLVAVTQAGTVVTRYAYDVRDRLRQVQSGTQPARTFTYDGRGFLVTETHPESGTTAYTYDARGHAKTRTTGEGTLSFTYDAAERVKTVKAGTDMLKEFTYDRPNSDSDFSLGKINTATRHNAFHSELNGQVLVTEKYFYAGPGGAISSKETALTLKSASGTTALQTFTDSYTYDPTGAIAQTTYPTCTGCAGLAGQPSRTITNTYAYGALSGVTSYTRGLSGSTRGIDYHANGMVQQIRHAKASSSGTGPVYTQTISDGIPRPASISVTVCAITISGQPQGQSIIAGQSVTLSVTAAGATSYQWLKVVNSHSETIPGATSATLTVSPSASTTYWVRVANGTCTVDSNRATVTVNACNATAAVSGSTTINYGQSAVVTTQLTGTAPWNLTWSDGYVQSNVQSSPAARSVSPLVTTTFTISSATDGGGCPVSASGSATITVKPPAPTNVDAWAQSSTSVRVTWSSPIAVDSFRVERCRASSCMLFPAQTESSMADNTATAGTAYVYRVYAFKGGTSSNGSAADLATTVIFADDPLPTITPTAVRLNHVVQLRTAVNAVRGCANQAPFGFTDSLVTATPIRRLHIEELRAALDAARAQLGLPPLSYTDTPMAAKLKLFSAHVMQLRGGVQ